MAIRPILHVAEAKKKNKASAYNDNFDMMMDFIDDSIGEAKDYVDAFMPAISSTTNGKFLTNDGTDASWDSLGNQPFGSYISGLIITKVNDDTIKVSSGKCYDATRTVLMSLATDTNKQETPLIANSTYYIYLIASSDLSLVDIAISTNNSTPLPISGYALLRKIGYYTTDANGKIQSIYYYGSNPEGVMGNVSFPDLTAGISKTFAEIKAGFYAEFDGWFRVGGTADGANSTYVDVNGNLMFYVMQSGTGGTVGYSTIIPVRKGDYIIGDRSTSKSSLSGILYPMGGN